MRIFFRKIELFRVFHANVANTNFRFFRCLLHYCHSKCLFVKLPIEFSSVFENSGSHSNIQKTQKIPDDGITKFTFKTNRTTDIPQNITTGRTKESQPKKTQSANKLDEEIPLNSRRLTRFIRIVEYPVDITSRIDFFIPVGASFRKTVQELIFFSIRNFRGDRNKFRSRNWAEIGRQCS